MSKMAYLINPAKKHVLDDDLLYEFKQQAEEKKQKAEEEKMKGEG